MKSNSPKDTTPSSSKNIIHNKNNSSPSFIDNIINFFKFNSKSSDNNDSEQCKCKRTNPDYCDNIQMLLDMTKTNMNFNSEKSKLLYQNLLKVHEKILDMNGDNIKQIKKDLGRTYPSSIMFKTPKTQQKLKNVLRAFSNYEPGIKYFQGMNFIVGFFLYHCEEHVAFWLFVSLFEEYGLRELFMDNFPGLNKHVHELERIIKKHFKKIYEGFARLDVKLNIFMVEWLYSLFSSLIPLELQLDFYKGFFGQGWEFFYKVCISVFMTLNGTFNDAEDIYIALKCGKNEDKDEDSKARWQKILNRAYQISFEDDKNKSK